MRKIEKILFHSTESYSPKNDKEKALVSVFLKLKTKEEIANFLRDLLTLSEIEEFANRLEMAKLLSRGWSYKRVAKELKVSTTTVTRVAHWLYRGCGGYWRIFKKS